MVSLGYLKSAEKLTVVVIKARNLPAISIKGTGWSYLIEIAHASASATTTSHKI